MPMQPLSPSPDHPVAHKRWWGIRAQLLLLLLPGVAFMQAFDSWGDHRERMGALESAYDGALLEPLSAFGKSAHFNAEGEIDLAAPTALQAMFGSVQARHKYLHVGLTPIDPDTPARERTLLGTRDLPAPPTTLDANGAVFYTAFYHGETVRIATLLRELQDAAGRRYRLRMQAAEGMALRNGARQASLRHEFMQDLRMLAITALLTWLGIAWALRPLKRLRVSLHARPTHDLRSLDASSVPFEVAPLVDAVNLHISDHRQLLAEQGQFLADASHQLRTPLAIMMTQAGYALREPDPKRLQETLRAIIEQLARSRRLSDQLLAMARASLTVDDAAPRPVIDLNALAREVVLLYLPMARDKSQDLGWVDIRGEDVPDSANPEAPAAPVHAHAAELHEAFANLIHNAIHYTPAGGRITVAVRIENGNVLAEVSDGGPGIEPQRREAVFQRFQRSGPADSSNTRKVTNGAGLGLAIARAYARRNGGDIVLSDTTQGQPGNVGLCAILTMPVAVGL